MSTLEQAKREESQKNYASAAELYKKEYLDGIGEDYLTVKAGEMFRLAGDFKNATICYENAIGCELETLYDRIIDFYFITKQYKRASIKYAEIFVNPTKKQKIALADRYFAEKQFNYAEQWYRKAIDKFNVTDNNYFLPVKEEEISNLNYFQKRGVEKGRIAFLNEDYKRAAICFKRASKNNDYVKIKCAEAYFMLRDFDRAKEIYRSIVQTSNDPYCMFMLAECYNTEDIDINSYENAFYWYEYALENGCNYAYYHLGICYQTGRGTDENLDRAKELFSEGTKYDIDKDKCLCKLGYFAMKDGNEDLAISYYQKAANLNSARALLNIAISYFESGNEYFSKEQIICYLAKSAALGSKRAKQMLEEIDYNRTK